jgi:hypothetical protein
MVFGVVTFDDKIFAIGGGPYPGITTTNVDKIYKIDGWPTACLHLHPTYTEPTRWINKVLFNKSSIFIVIIIYHRWGIDALILTRIGS